MSALVLYLQFTRMTFLQMLAYRLRYYTGIATYLIFVAGNATVYRAIYASLPAGAAIGGYDLTSVIGYVSIAWVGRSLVFNNIDREIAMQVSGGNIAQSLLKPVDFQRMIYFGALGELGFRFLLFTIPISLVIFPLFGLPGPAGPAAAAWGLVSFALAFLVNSGVNFITGAMALHLKSIEGLIRAKFIVMELLTGTLVPLTFFPDSVRKVAEVLPFAGIAYVPVSIWMGTIRDDAMLRALALQAFWAVLLYVIGAAVWAHGVRRTTVQGG